MRKPYKNIHITRLSGTIIMKFKSYFLKTFI